MSMKHWLIIIILCGLLTACTGQAPSVALSTQLYRDPSGIYALPYPDGWSYSVDVDSNTVTFRCKGFCGTDDPLQRGRSLTGDQRYPGGFPGRYFWGLGL